jgi:hypothetical protein
MADLIQILRKPPETSPAVAERLREFVARRTPSAERSSTDARVGLSGVVSRCEFCGVAIDDAHGHLVDLPRRTLLCVCRPCYLLFTHDGAGGARFRAVPDRYQLVPEFAAARETWERLQLPIGLAFFFTNGSTGRTTAFYPSPAGATESELPLDAWQEAMRALPAVARMAADVEALLVRRTDTVVDALILPIDSCYELVGRIRRAWRGFQGGDEVWREIDDFFARARARAETSGA